MTYPANIAFGRVVGRYLLAVADTPADEDHFPDPIPASGTVTFTPAAPTVYVTGENAATVIPKAVAGSLNAEGRVTDPTGTEGVWLVIGQYDVRVSIPGVDIPTFRISVKAEHTAEAPLELALAAPLKPAASEVFVVNRQVYLDALAARDAANDARAAAELVRVETVALRDETLAARDEVGSRTLTATVDPDNPALLILNFPGYMLHADGSSVLIPLEG